MIFILLVCLILCNTVLSLCPNGYFILESMNYCVPLLKCGDISRLIIENPIGFGSTKLVYRALWGKHNVTYLSLRDRRYRYDFHYGLNILKTLSPSSYIVQLLGFCEEKDIIITEYHKHNNALFFLDLGHKLSLKDTFNFCVSYAKIIFFLHNSPMGVLVNCDSNDLSKLLSQLLITDDLNLVLGDVDALPEVRVNSSVLCGRRQIISDFSAPEQLWNHPGEFNFKSMKGYGEKTDIWKVPDVCIHFLKPKYFELLQYLLFDIHSKCKEMNPLKRPSAHELAMAYMDVAKSL